MSGTLLRTGTLQEFKALGVDGQPVYSVALQLREAIRLKLRREAADCLAIPQTNQTGDRIDWYAPFEGDVVPWSAAVPQERQQALTQLEAMQSDLHATSQAMQKDTQNRENQIFGRLLEKALQFPDPEHVYLVEGKPVVTFWGFSKAEGEVADPLLQLRPAAASAPPPPEAAPMPPPAAATVVVKPRSKWRWLWWLLLLPLLLLLILFLLRACAPTIELPLNLSQLDLPSLPPSQQEDSAHDLRVYDRTVIGGGSTVTGSDSAINGGDSLLNGSDSTNANLSGTDEGDAPAPANSDAAQDAKDGKDSAKAPSDDEAGKNPAPPVDPKATAKASPLPPELEQKDESDNPSTNNTGPNANKPMTLPPQALKNGSTGFLDGNWKAGAGIQDAKTGKPLQLDYAFDKAGKGNVQIQRSDGVRCSGAVNAAVSGGHLTIGNQGQATCSDGSTYKLPEVVCKPDAKSTADCTGHYDNQKFPMSMQQSGQ